MTTVPVAILLPDLDGREDAATYSIQYFANHFKPLEAIVAITVYLALEHPEVFDRLHAYIQSLEAQSQGDIN